MTTFEEKLKNEAHSLSLSSQEKDRMRETLSVYMAEHPLLRRSPYRSSFWFSTARYAAPLFAVLILCAGTAYAAQGSLPGNLLYPVKVNVNEEVMGALAVTPSAKASFNAGIAAERVKEAQELAAENQLTATTTTELQSNFQAHVSAAASYTNEVAAADPAEGAQLEAQLSAVSAEGAVLSEIGSQSGNAQVEKVSHAFGSYVEQTALSTAEASSSEATVGGTATSTGTQAASVREEAEVALVQAQNAYAAFEASGSATSTATTTGTAAAFDAAVSGIQTLIGEGDVVASSSSPMALHAYEEALSAGVVLTTFLTAGAQFHGNLLPVLLGNEIASSNATTSPKLFDHHHRSPLPTGETFEGSTTGTTTASGTVAGFALDQGKFVASSSVATSSTPESRVQRTVRNERGSSAGSVPNIFDFFP